MRGKWVREVITHVRMKQIFKKSDAIERQILQ